MFIPEIRWFFHRNDLIVAHSHVALAIGVFFMVLAMFSKEIKAIGDKAFYKIYMFGILGIFTVLSISGFVQVGFISLDIGTLWKLRTLFGFIVLFSLLPLISIKINFSKLQTYNLLGVLNDGLGGLFLILLAAYIYPLLGFSFEGKYEYVVFAFVATTGYIHFLALRDKEHAKTLTSLSATIRVWISALFFALYLSNVLGLEALFISAFDFLFSSYYWVFLHKRGVS